MHKDNNPVGRWLDHQKGHNMKIGDKFYDEKNCRYLTVDGVGTDPQVYACIVEELTDDGEDFEVTGRALFKEYELKHMEVIA